MDNLILSDNKVLNQQVCTECLNYLSVGPVLVSHVGNVICGRCNTSKQSKLSILYHSLYNLVAGQLVFRCINYYEGCEELLNFNEAIEHEEHCKKDDLKCPFCDYKGNGCQLVHHFDENHPEYLVEEGTFKILINETFSKNLIFVEKNIIFCLNLSIKESIIEFFNVLVSPVHLGPKHFKVKFFKSGTDIEFVTRPIQVTHELDDFPPGTFFAKNIGCNVISNQIRNSFLLDQTFLFESFPSGWCWCKIELIDICNNCEKREETIMKQYYLEKVKKNIDIKLPVDEFKETRAKEGNEENFDINCVLRMPHSDLRTFASTELYVSQHCVNCKKYIIPVVYFCPKSHMACKECSGNKCVKCGILCMWSIKPKYNISLPCEWDGCSSSPDIFNYITHKRVCTMRQYKCPDVDCEFRGVLVELKKHWHMNPLFDCNEFKFGCRNQSLFWHISYCREMFYVSLEYNSASKMISIVIRQVDVVMPTCYKFLVDYSTNSVNYTNIIEEPLEDSKDFIAVGISEATLKFSFKLSCMLKEV